MTKYCEYCESFLRCAINPARDLAPRVFTLLAGWGPGVFTEFSHWYYFNSGMRHAKSNAMCFPGGLSLS